MKYDRIAARITAKLSVPKDKIIHFSQEPFKDALAEFKNRRFKDGFKSLEKGLSDIVAMLHVMNAYTDNDQASMGLGIGKDTKKHMNSAILKLSEAKDAISILDKNLGDAD